ncbi:permease [Thermodesulfovibrionales bacterium]|nr:permease [Thermodesulfovibrionales bacterium]
MFEVAELIVSILTYTWEFVKKAAPWLLLGFLFAGLLKAFVPSDIISRYLGKRSFSSVLIATFIGLIIPLCSCGVLPLAISLYKSGASRASALAFLIATPATSITAVIVTAGMLGWKFALLKILIVVAIVASAVVLVQILFRGESPISPAVKRHNLGLKVSYTPVSYTSVSYTFIDKIKRAFRYGFIEMVDDMGLYIIIGLFAAGVVSAVVPPDMIERYLGEGLIPLIIMVLVGAPMYICTIGSLPFVYAMIEAGMNPHAGLVFLIVGPVTNLAVFLVVAKSMGKKTAAVYVGSVIVFSILFTYLISLSEWL